MLKGELNWIVKHAIEVVVGAIIVGALGWLTSNYIKFFLDPPPRIEPLDGEVFDMEVPQWWLASPERASLVFSKDVEIVKTRKIYAGLAVGNERGDRWEVSNRQTLLAELKAPRRLFFLFRMPAEQLCHITNADKDHDRYYIGLRLQCEDSDICSFHVKGNILRVVTRDVSIIISEDCDEIWVE